MRSQIFYYEVYASAKQVLFIQYQLFEQFCLCLMELDSRGFKLQKLDQFIFNRQFESARQILQDSNFTTSKQIGAHLLFIKQKIRIYVEVAESEKLHVQNFERVFKEIGQLGGSDPSGIELKIHRLILKLFLCQFIPKVPEEAEKEIQRELKELPCFRQILKIEAFSHITRQFCAGVTVLELYIQKIISRDTSSTLLQDIEAMLEFHAQLMRVLDASSRYIKGEQLMKKLFYIIIHRVIGFYNSSLKVSYQKVLKFYVYLFQPDYSRLIEGKLEIALLYNILKIGVLQQTIDLSQIFRYYQRDQPSSNPQEHIVGVFCILNSQIMKRSEATLHSSGTETSDFKMKLWNSLYIYCNINFTSIVHKLDTIVKSIISYRVASLLSVISTKYNVRNLTRFFVEKMYDSPFNHDIQTIKLCIEMFNASEFIKIDQLAKLVVSSMNSSKLVEREVLIAMCSIFKGVILQNRQIGLAYAKLNHQQYLKNSQGRILMQDTLLAHIGFAYYNLAKHEIYVESKMSFNAKALENFAKSYDLNHQNYLVSYSLAKLYLQNYDYENAYKYAVIACRNNKDNWEPFALLACIYMCQKKMHKSQMIISQLLGRHQKSATLYYIKAYSEVNKLLTQVNNNEEVEASKFLGPEYYETYKEKVLRSKDIKEILALLETSFRLLGFISDPAFTQSFLSKVKLPEYSDEITEQTYYKALKNAFELFYAIDQLILCEVIVKKLSTQSAHNEGDYRYYKGLIHEKKKENNQAYEEYKLLNKENPYHCGALIRLALLEQNTDRANKYIELVSKFKDNEDFNFAKGTVLSREGEYQAAHSYFLKEARTCWVEMLPDFMYYY